MDLIEQRSLNWNSELFDKVFIDFADIDIGVLIKNHKLITAFSENNVLLMTLCMKNLINWYLPMWYVALDLALLWISICSLYNSKECF